jgi:hypothetical protein
MSICINCSLPKQLVNNLCSKCSKIWKICPHHLDEIVLVSIKKNICKKCVHNQTTEAIAILNQHKHKPIINNIEMETPPSITPPQTPRHIVPEPLKFVDIRKYLVIPYDEKDEVRSRFPNKLLWDDTKKQWYTEHTKTYNQLTKYHIHILTLPFANKDKGKRIGAKWNGARWYCSEGHYQVHKGDFDALEHVEEDV